MRQYISIARLRMTLILTVVAVVASLGAFVSHPKIEAAYDETRDAFQKVLAVCEDRVSQGANIRSLAFNHRAHFDAQAILAFDAAHDVAKKARVYQNSTQHDVRQYWAEQYAYERAALWLIESSTLPPSAELGQTLLALKSANKAVADARSHYNAKVKIYNEARSGLMATPVAYLTHYRARPLLE